ncbi:MAG: amidohydrolase family protein [Gemmatimonas sp.]|nr:amidohydrolase family protein [Gemmatimonas sp.]
MNAFLRRATPVLAILTAVGCEGTSPAEGASMQAYVGARLIDGTGTTPVDPAVIIVQDGVLQAVGPVGEVEIPEGAERIDLSDRTVIPGLINTHGHVGDVRGLESGNYSRENVLEQLGRFARYGVTTVVSLGDDQEAGVQIRDEQDDPALDRARVYVAGPVLNPSSPEEAVEQVQRLTEWNVDWAKIRIDSNLGASDKMAPEVYGAVIDEAHRQGIPVAVHIVELADAKGALEAGADLIAHSVRDQLVDDELIALLRQQRVCLAPTLTRELSTFVYGSRPDFFDDPFFLGEVDPAVLEELQDPERQRQTQESRSAQYWEDQLPVALENVKLLSDAGVTVAMGTDSGPAGRFQGYFEHLELEMMADAGLTPMQILVASTGDAATCVGLEEELGTLEPGKRADFVVLTSNPLDDIANTRTIESVWINGNRVPDEDP